MNTRIWIVAGLVFTAITAHASTAGEITASGFVFAGPQGARIREQTSIDAKVIVTAPPGTRLAYRRIYEIGGERTWYYAVYPGKPSGWVSAKEVDTKRPGIPPTARPVELKDSGIGDVKITAGMTAAARGLDARARAYGEKQDMKLTVDQFVTLEDEVGRIFSDKPDAKGQYDDQKEHGPRKRAAQVFKGGLK